MANLPQIHTFMPLSTQYYHIKKYISYTLNSSQTLNDIHEPNNPKHPTHRVFPARPNVTHNRYLSDNLAEIEMVRIYINLQQNVCIFFLPLILTHTQMIIFV